MLIIDQISPEDIDYIAEISESVFSNDPETAPAGYKNRGWYYDVINTGYLYKIVLDGKIIGGFVAFRTGNFNFQLERIFILPEHQHLGVGKKAVGYAFKRFPEAKVWYADVKPAWDRYSRFLTSCGFFETGFTSGGTTRFIKLLK